MCAIMYFFLIVCNKPRANSTIIYENIKEIHILAIGGTLEFPILSHMLLRRDKRNRITKIILSSGEKGSETFCNKTYDNWLIGFIDMAMCIFLNV